MAEIDERNDASSSEDWSEDEDMQCDDVVEKVEHSFYAVLESARRQRDHQIERTLF